MRTDLDGMDCITFPADRCVQRLPAGEYVGKHCETAYSLGGNGLQRKWHTVTIIEAPDHAVGIVGRNVVIWTENNAA